MDVLLQHVADRLVNHLMALQGAFARKMLRYDGNGKVPAAAFGAFVTGMEPAVISDLDFRGGEGRAQAVFDLGSAIHSGEHFAKRLDADLGIYTGFDIGIGIGPILCIFH